MRRQERAWTEARLLQWFQLSTPLHHLDSNAELLCYASALNKVLHEPSVHDERSTLTNTVLENLVSRVLREREGSGDVLPAVAIDRVGREFKRGGLGRQEVVGEETVYRVFHDHHHHVDRGKHLAT